MASELWLKNSSTKSFRVMWNLPLWSFTMAKSVRVGLEQPVQGTSASRCPTWAIVSGPGALSACQERERDKGLC